MTGIESALLKACHCCGLVQELPHVPLGSRASCARCGSSMSRPGRRATSNRRAVAAALAALILYPFAISMPIMRLERFGNFKDASIWTGSVGMLERGEIFVGTVVLLCSVIIPFLKLVGLLSITVGRRLLTKRHRALTYRVIEWTGRWGMLDVLLIAIVVAWIKIGDVVEVSAGPAALAFTAVVLMSLLASAWFDPHALWEEESS